VQDERGPRKKTHSNVTHQIKFGMANKVAGTSLSAFSPYMEKIRKRENKLKWSTKKHGRIARQYHRVQWPNPLVKPEEICSNSSANTAIGQYSNVHWPHYYAASNHSSWPINSNAIGSLSRNFPYSPGQCAILYIFADFYWN